jgi:hypothetical protein
MSAVGNVTGASGVGSEEFLMKGNSHAGLFQVTFAAGTTGTVTLFGKLSATHDYFELDELTGSGMSEIAICPHMKVEWSLVTSTAEITIMEAM